MVYIYVCKKFKVTMDLISGKDSDWVNNLLQFYCKHSKITGKLERAEINPKKRTSIVAFDSSSDLFKVNMVYKDSKGSEHELKWVIKITRSDASEAADSLLRHEKQVYARLIGDLANVVRQKSASRLEGSRISAKDLLPTPQFIYEEVAHQGDLARNVLVLENLEERDFQPIKPGLPINLSHMKLIVRTVAKFHAVSLAYKQNLFAAFKSQVAQAKANRQIDEVVMEGENRVLTGRLGILARYPFISNQNSSLAYLIDHRDELFDMYRSFLECFPRESYLADIFDYIRLSAADILHLDSDISSETFTDDSPFDAIVLGVLEARSFLFKYEEDEDDDDKENGLGGFGGEKKKKKSGKIQRSQSERIKKDSSKTGFEALRIAKENEKKAGGIAVQANHKASPAKCPKLEQQTQGTTNKMRNKFLQNVIGKSKDDEKVPLTTIRRTSKVNLDRDPNQPPKRAALINAKYVTYGRITRDVAVLFWTAGSSLIRRNYMIKLLECYAETLGITLGHLGVDTDALGLGNYLSLVRDFQTQLLYGFLVSVLVCMANTSPQELKEFKAKGGAVIIDKEAHWADKEQHKQQCSFSDGDKYFPLSKDRVVYMLDLMRDIGAYIESRG